jgi:hypothetical protein
MQCELQHLLRTWRKRNLTGADLLTRPDNPQYLLAYLLNRDTERTQHLRHYAILLTKQAEQLVLGADVVVLESPRLLLREDHDLAGGRCESFEQTRRVACQCLAGKRTYWHGHAVRRTPRRRSVQP